MNLYHMQQIFSTIFYLSNKIQVQGDQLDERITVRQWMTLLAILHLPENGASYNQIADKMGCSKQNVKQLITNLEKRNYVELEKNEKDKRAVNVKITEQCSEVMKSYFIKGNELLNKTFESFDEVELEILWGLLKKMAYSDGTKWIGYEKEVGFGEMEGNYE